MRLTSFTDYGLRVLMLLGLRDGELVSVRQMAAVYGLSEYHLLKIVQALARLGYVKPVRGRSGGIRLAMKPEKVNLGKVVRQMESGFALVDCMDEQRRNACVIHSACQLRKALARAVQAFLGVLGQYTLADALRKPGRIQSVLGLQSASTASRARSRRRPRRRAPSRRS